MSADNCEFLLQNIVVSGQFMSHLILYKRKTEILQNDAVFSLWLPLCFVNDTIVTTNMNKRLVLSVLLKEFMQ